VNKIVLSILILSVNFAALAQNRTTVNIAPNPGDARTAINNAINTVYEAGGGTVQLGAGIYNVGGQVRIKSGVTIRGAGRTKTILRSISPTNSSVIATADVKSGEDHIAVEDLTLDGNFRARAHATASVLVLTATDGRQSKDVRISRVNIVDSPFAGMQFFSVADLTVEDCLVDGTLRDGITIWDKSDRVKVLRNSITNIGDDGVALNAQRPSEWRYRINDAIISDNYIRHSLKSHLGTGIRLGAAHRVICSHNTIALAYGTGIVVDGGGDNGGGDGDLPLEIAATHTVTGSPNADAEQEITLAGSMNGPWEAEFLGEFSTPIMTDPTNPHATSNVTSDQVCDALAATKSIGPNNVSVSGPSGGPYKVIFQGQLARRPVPLLILRPYASSVDVTVSDNTIQHAGNPKNGNAGISARAYSSRVRIVGNSVSGYFRHGISVSANGVQVRNNVIGPGQDEAKSNGINITGADAIVTGNRITGSPSNGIAVNGLRAKVQSNTIADSGRSDARAKAIYVGTAASGCTIVDNVLIGANQANDIGFKGSETSRNTISRNKRTLSDSSKVGRALIRLARNLAIHGHGS
jgi:hypothetical protein